jgi:hypothetical protein
MNSTIAYVLGAIGVILSALVAWRATKIQAKASPYAVLAERVLALEDADRDKAERISTQTEQIEALKADLRQKTQRIELLEGDFDVLIPEMLTWEHWIETGAAPPPPMIGPAAKAVLAHRAEHRERARRSKSKILFQNEDGDYATN